ncbi:MAG: tetratricopeptide repeat protein [Caulobacterales bacterium]|nr:tetratricopeptide repeat protein [Caulobacterales bacterium]
MSDRLAAAQAALTAGRRDEAIEHLIAAVDEDAARPSPAYRALVGQLYGAGRYEEGLAYARKALERHPRDYDLNNSYGVLLRKLRRQPEAVKALEQAIKLNPKAMAAQQNLGNVFLDLNENARAEAIFTKLVRLEPRNLEFLRLLARSLSKQGKVEPALVRLRQAISIRKDNVDCWLDLVGLLNEEYRSQEAEEQLERALGALPGNRRLLEGKVMILRRGGQGARAEAFMEEQLALHPEAAWLHYQLSSLIGDRNRERACALARRALELEPGNLDYATSLIENLERNRIGDEGAHIEEAYQLGLRLLPRKAEFGEAATKILTETFIRVADYEAVEALGDFTTVGRNWASSGRHSALLKQLSRIGNDDDRRELVEQHRIWGRMAESAAARRPVKRPPPRAPGGKIRLGLLSSDLRQHPVGYFALPLFDHIDNERFEVFVYSYYLGKEDPAQRYITSKVSAYRWSPEINVSAAAQQIADDQLDILIELGGSTHMNKLEVMAYKAAPLQASWLGYPHSAGLATIDYFICDQYSRPTKPEYLIETPLEMPRSWVALGKAFFAEREITPGLPSDRNGFITYGTANNPHKYNPRMLRAWARIVAATPGSKFAFIRPEGSGASFRRNIEAQFALEGVSPDRLVFHVIRGAHLPFYNEVDLTLDTFPLTGGTTTTESLWMGVPLVTLRGEMFHERLSYSILSNAGLGDLCTDDLDEYQRLALQLAADTDRRRALRTGLRDMIRNSALGQTEQFARDFYDMLHRAVTERAGARATA